MFPRRKKLVLFALSLAMLLAGVYLLSLEKTTKAPLIAEDRLSPRIKEVKAFVNSHPSYNERLAFFVDMKIRSGRNRFFICDLKHDKIIDRGLVAHGSGSETGVEGELRFSNTNNSYCTSLGKYYIGNSYNGQFGKAYKLYGLDKTNDSAYVRNIVLHTYDRVPEGEQDRPICRSLGCPMVNKAFYKRLESIIDSSDKKILMYIYY